MNYRNVFILGALALGMAACNQAAPQASSSKVLGTLEVTFSSDPSQAKAVLRPLASIPVADSAITVGAINSTFGTDGTFKYVRAQVNLTANQAFANLTLYAYNKSTNLGGTALNNLVNFVGGNTPAEAQSLLPVHARAADGTYIADTQDFQAFSSSEAAALDTAATTASIIGASDTVLQYGFVARKNATTRAFTGLPVNSDTGSVNLAYKVPAAQNNGSYKFTATFVVANETVSRVTRDMDETAVQANTRATDLNPDATEVMLVGVDTQGTAARSGGLRFSNIKIGTSTNLLPDPALAIFRAGSGTGSLVNTGNPVFIDKFNTTGSSQTAASSIAMPTVVSGANKQLIASGTATSDGALALSEDGKCLTMIGYARDIGLAGALNATSSSSISRIIGVVNSSGSINTTTSLADAYSGTSGNTAAVRSATSDNCSRFWTAGNASTTAEAGVRFVGSVGATTSIKINTGTNTQDNMRIVSIFGGQLYVVSGSAGIRIGSTGTALPTATGENTTLLPGIPVATGSPYSIFLADLDNTVAGLDTLYVSDDTNTTGVGGINKYALVAGTWIAKGIGGAFGDAYRGLTGIVDGTTVTLFATRKGGSGATGGGELVSLTDSSGYNANLAGTPTLLATATTNTAFRGVALQPR